MLFLRHVFVLPIFCHKLATTCHIDSYEVSNSKLKPDLCSCVKTEMIESTVLPQQSHKQDTFFGHPVCSIIHSLVFRPSSRVSLLPQLFENVILGSTHF